MPLVRDFIRPRGWDAACKSCTAQQEGHAQPQLGGLRGGGHAHLCTACASTRAPQSETRTLLLLAPPTLPACLI